MKEQGAEYYVVKSLEEVKKIINWGVVVMIEIINLPKLIEKLGDGYYKIKVKNGKIVRVDQEKKIDILKK